MKIEAEIDEKKVKNLTTEAKGELTRQVSKFVNNIVDEASLIEEARRENGASPEITGNIIIQSIRKRNKNYNKKSKFEKACKLIPQISFLFTGFLFDTNGFKNNLTKLIFFLLFFVVGTITTVISFVKDDE